ncbi:hypothetical protein ACVITL_006451 [Rhizobium pisi]
MLDGNSSLAYGLSAMVHMFNETQGASAQSARSDELSLLSRIGLGQPVYRAV